VIGSKLGVLYFTIIVEYIFHMHYNRLFGTDFQA